MICFVIIIHLKSLTNRWRGWMGLNWDTFCWFKNDRERKNIKGNNEKYNKLFPSFFHTHIYRQIENLNSFPSNLSPWLRRNLSWDSVWGDRMRWRLLLISYYIIIRNWDLIWKDWLDKWSTIKSLSLSLFHHFSLFSPIIAPMQTRGNETPNLKKMKKRWRNRMYGW